MELELLLRTGGADGDLPLADMQRELAIGMQTSRRVKSVAKRVGIRSLSHPLFFFQQVTSASWWHSLAWLPAHELSYRYHASVYDISLSHAAVSGWQVLDDFMKEIREFLSCYEPEDFAKSLAPWNEVITLTQNFDSRLWFGWQLGLMSGNVRGATERGGGAASLIDDTFTLTQRVRYAQRLRSDTRYWSEQLTSVKTGDQPICTAFVLSAFFTRSESQVLRELLPAASEIINKLPSEIRDMLRSSLLDFEGHWRNAKQVDVGDLDSTALTGTVEYLWWRLIPQHRLEPLVRAFRARPDAYLADLVAGEALEGLSVGSLGFSTAIELGLEAFELGARPRSYITAPKSISPEIAQGLMSQARDLPSNYLVWALRGLNAARSRRVSTIAREQRWFA